MTVADVVVTASTIGTASGRGGPPFRRSSIDRICRISPASPALCCAVGRSNRSYLTVTLVIGSALVWSLPSVGPSHSANGWSKSPSAR